MLQVRTPPIEEGENDGWFGVVNNKNAQKKSKVLIHSPKGNCCVQQGQSVIRRDIEKGQGCIWAKNLVGNVRQVQRH